MALIAASIAPSSQSPLIEASINPSRAASTQALRTRSASCCSELSSSKVLSMLLPVLCLLPETFMADLFLERRMTAYTSLLNHVVILYHPVHILILCRLTQRICRTMNHFIICAKLRHALTECALNQRTAIIRERWMIVYICGTLFNKIKVLCEDSFVDGMHIDCQHTHDCGKFKRLIYAFCFSVLFGIGEFILILEMSNGQPGTYQQEERPS